MSRERWRPPWPVVTVAAFAILFFVLPLVGLLRQVRWGHLASDLTSTAAVSALRLSLVCSTAAMAASVLFGIPLAWVLARMRLRAKPIFRALVLLPMVLPPVVGGVALLAAFSRRGLVGSRLYDWFGVQLTFSTFGAVMAETFVAMPFFVITVEAALRSLDPRVEEAASALGASRWMVFRRITLPSIRPAVIAGGVLAWARALGEFGATITFAGNIVGRTQTLPLAVYLALEARPELAIALSLVMLVTSVAVIAALRDRWLQRP